MSQQIRRLGKLTYQRCKEILGTRSSVKIGHNTYLERRRGQRTGSDVFAVRLHATDVIRFGATGGIVLDSGGWRTVTTKQRMRELTGANVYAKDHQWYVNGVPFYDGIMIS